MEKILVSACLIGQPVRYDGTGKPLTHTVWQQWRQQGRLITICPECAGGLATPRAPAEQQRDGRVMTCDGQDVTHAFQKGAELALALAQKYQIKLAILKANSPSCGNEQIYDGSFQGRKIEGQGLTAKCLSDSGIQVFNELQIEEALGFLHQLEPGLTESR